MKINKIQIKNIIKEELQNLLDEFKAPERMQGIPNPEDMGFKLPEVDAQMISKLKKDIVESGLLDFVKNNFPFKSLQTIGGLKESKKEADNLDLILQNVELMKNGRTWQNNFHTNLQVLKAKLDDLPTEFSRYKTHTEYYEQGEFLQNWVGVFEMELAKTWAERNLPTFKKFAKDNKEKLSAIFQKFSTFSKQLFSLEGHSAFRFLSDSCGWYDVGRSH